MKRTLTLLVGLAIVGLSASAQKAKAPKGSGNDSKKGTLFGISYNVTDFNAPKNFGTNSNATSLPLKNMSHGISVSYWKGINSKIDFHARLNGIFHDYRVKFQGQPANTEIGIELEPTINVRPIKDANIWNPFLTAGAGLGLYTNKIGAYIPMGGGIQFNASNTTYFFIQANYKLSLTKDVVGNNMFYSIGFAENIGK